MTDNHKNIAHGTDLTDDGYKFNKTMEDACEIQKDKACSNCALRNGCPNPPSQYDTGLCGAYERAKLHEDAEKAKAGAEAFLHTALGGNKNVATLTFLSLEELLEAYAEHLLVAIGRQANDLAGLRTLLEECEKKLKAKDEEIARIKDERIEDLLELVALRVKNKAKDRALLRVVGIGEGPCEISAIAQQALKGL